MTGIQTLAEALLRHHSAAEPLSIPLADILRLRFRDAADKLVAVRSRARQTAAAIADAGMSPAAFVAGYLDWRAATKEAMSCCFSSQVSPSA